MLYIFRSVQDVFVQLIRVPWPRRLTPCDVGLVIVDDVFSTFSLLYLFSIIVFSLGIETARTVFIT